MRRFISVIAIALIAFVAFTPDASAEFGSTECSTSPSLPWAAGNTIDDNIAVRYQSAFTCTKTMYVEAYIYLMQDKGYGFASVSYVHMPSRSITKTTVGGGASCSYSSSYKPFLVSVKFREKSTGFGATWGSYRTVNTSTTWLKRTC